jgi:F-type H+-transporting ATPase subunit epsilon
MAELAKGKLHFELVSPERLLASMAVDMVVVPGAEGDIGVLVEHAPVVSLLRPGVIAVYEGDRVTRRIFVAGGFAEINEAGCIVLAEEALPVEELDGDRARQALKDAEADLAALREPKEGERERLEQAVAIAQARVEALAAA